MGFPLMNLQDIVNPDVVTNNDRTGDVNADAFHIATTEVPQYDPMAKGSFFNDFLNLQMLGANSNTYTPQA